MHKCGVLLLEAHGKDSTVVFGPSATLDGQPLVVNYLSRPALNTYFTLFGERRRMQSASTIFIAKFIDEAAADWKHLMVVNYFKDVGHNLLEGPPLGCEASQVTTWRTP